MSQLLKNWLARDIHTELSRGVDWLKLSDEVKQEDEDGVLDRQAFEDDGSNLRIPVDYGAETRQYLQISKFTQTKPVVKALLSDGQHSILAKFTGSCVRRFEGQYEGRIFARTHGIISVRDFNIVATDYGEPSGQVSLEIDDMEWAGSLDSAFGNPLAIYEREDIVVQLRKLSKVRQRSNSTPIVFQEIADATDDENPAPSADNANMIGDEDDMDSSAFYTQIQPSTQRPASHLAARNTVQKQSIPGVNRDSPILAGNVQVRPEREENQRLDLMKQLKVIELLQRGGGQASFSNPRTAESPRNGFAPSSTTHSGSHSEIHTNIQTHRSFESIPTLNKPSNNASSRGGSSPEAADRSVQTIEPEPLIDVTLPRNEVVSSSWTEGLMLSRDRCSIPLEQQAILNKDSSWLPSLPGRAFLGPSIPIRTLESLNHLAEVDAGNEDLEEEDIQTIRLAEKSNSSHDCDQISEKNDHTGLEGSEDSHNSEMSWPPSSPPIPPAHLQVGLPPDSSALQIESPKRPAVSRLSQTPARSQTRLPPDSSAPRLESRTRPAVGGLSQADAIDLIESDSEADDVQARARSPMSTADSETRAMQAIPSSPPGQAITIDDRSANNDQSAADDSDDEMEFAVPEVLANKSIHEVPKLQIKETPNLQGQRKMERNKFPSSWSPARQRSSGQTASSTSIIPSTYIEPPGHPIARSATTKRTHTQVEPSSDADDVMLDEQLQGEIEAASQRLSSSAARGSPFNRVQNNSTPARSPTLVTHKSTGNPNPLVKRKATDLTLPIGQNQSSSKRPKLSGFDLPPTSDMADGDNAVTPLTVREQRRMKLNSYGSISGAANVEQALLSSKMATNGQGSTGLQNPAPKFPPSSPLVTPHSHGSPPVDRQHNQVATHFKRPRLSTLNNETHSKINTHISSEPQISSGAKGTPSNTPGNSSNSTTETIFLRFSQAYPEYKGTRHHFQDMCKQIDDLQKEKKLLRMLWDDFVIRHHMEYAEYKRTCTATGNQALTYHDFFNESTEDRKFTKRILTPDDLKIMVEQTSDSAPSSPKLLANAALARRPPTSPSDPGNGKRFRKSVPWENSRPAQDHGHPRSSLPSLPSHRQRSKPIPPTPVKNRKTAIEIDGQRQEGNHIGPTTLDYVQADVEEDHPRLTAAHGQVNEADQAKIKRTHERAIEAERANPMMTTHGQVNENKHPNAMIGVQDTSEADKDENDTNEIPLHENPNSEFRNFVRGYATSSMVGGRLGIPDEKGFLRLRRTQPIDAMAWPLGFMR